MSTTLLLPYLALLATLMRGLLVAAKLATPTCARCGHAFERKQLGERVCSCR